MYFIFKCDCLSGSNYIGNCTLEIAFSVNLQKAQFQNILSLRPNHCGPSRDPKSDDDCRLLTSDVTRDQLKLPFKAAHFHISQDSPF